MEPRLTAGPMPNAPGLTLCAGVCGYPDIGTISATGVDENPEDARGKCLAELAERSAVARLRGTAQPADEHSPTWMARAAKRDLAMSPCCFGVAAGRSPREAEINARRELEERWRGRLWWAGVDPPGETALATRDHCEDMMAKWRARRRPHEGALTLSAGTEGTVVAVWSADRNGGAMTIGLGCAETEMAAALSALRERLSMEFGLALIRAKRRRGSPLSDRERDIAAAADSAADLGRDPRFTPSKCRPDGSELVIAEAPRLETPPSPDPRFAVALAADTSRYARRFGDRRVFGPDALGFLA